jgi:UDP-N-acetylmuramoyl-tripeptide--D-alanyl-D-alanine ligase
MRLLLRKRISVLTDYLATAAAFLWRRLMFRTTFIAITGSAGKSTATACMGSILSSHAPTNWLPGGRNSLTLRILLNTRFRHRFAVIETGSNTPGELRRAARLIAPDVVVVLRVLSIHSNVFPTIEAVAEEKAGLLSRLTARDTVILNGDDPRVLAMAERSPARVCTFGLLPESFVVADQVSAVWPQRLTFRVRCGDQSARIETNLLGEQFLPSVLAAVATAISCGVPLEQCAAALKNMQPVLGRMSPMQLSNGACIVRDEFNANLPSLMSGLDFLAQAQAARRIVVVGDVLDTGLTVRPRARDLGRRVAQVADMAVFLGKNGRLACRSAVEAGMGEETVSAYEDFRAAADFLKSELRAGDLVLSSGWAGRHLERVFLSQVGNIGCWIERCSIVRPCEMCSKLKLVPFPPAR